jgi:hypothetical protein
MSKSNSLIQQNIVAAITAKAEEKQRQRQENCRHDFLVVPYFDFANDRIYYSARCRRCDYVEE